MSFLRQISLVWWAFIIILVYCESGQIVVSQFDEFEEEISKCDWYALPIETQKLFVVFLLNEQQTSNIHGFGNIECSRESMKKVISFYYI